MEHSFTNRLIKETSPYLLQHAHNPVDWYPWGVEALEKAQRENKPILVSIGYSTCHWCHVMERESFENEIVAAFMNQHFINIKVDREERPDIDNIYMEAVQLISEGKGGGWPLNCFLLPDGRPFFGGTYFPPNALSNRPSWIQVLKNISHAFNNSYPEVNTQADKIMHYLSKIEEQFMSDLEDSELRQQKFTPHELEEIYNNLKENFDPTSGGFGYAPKFPSVMALRYCLNYYVYSGEMDAMAHLQLSLDAMIYGGIYDQLRGGFARYTVDKEWLVPHFEKMLYDNALLIGLLADTYKVTKKELYATTIHETIKWVEAEMWSKENSFFSALDADTEGKEGKFYIWSKSEILEILKDFGADEKKHYCNFYDISDDGNWEGYNILHRCQSVSGYTAQHNLDIATFRTLIANMNEVLLEARNLRTRPNLDDKQLLAWNAMMCTAYCKAYQALGEAKYLQTAQENMRFILDNLLVAEQELKHSYKNGIAKTDAFLDDYALVIEALIELYQTTSSVHYLYTARDLVDYTIAYFIDPVDQMFYYTVEGQNDVILRKKDMYDSAIPSGNATMVHNLKRLGVLLDNVSYREQATLALMTMKSSILKYPQSFGRWASAIFWEVEGAEEVAIIGSAYKEFSQEMQRYYWYNVVFCSAENASIDLPLLIGRQVDSQTRIFICKNYSCQLPLMDVESAVNILSK